MLIIHAHILTMEDSPSISDGYIRIHQGKIVSLGTMDCTPPDDGEIIDARGAYLLPGLIDAHCHIGMWEDALDREGDDGNEDTDPITPHLRALDAVNPMDRCFSEALAAGVTGVLTGPGSANPIGGQFVFLRTSGRCADDMALLQPACMKFALGENPKRVYGDKKRTPATRMATAALIREALFQANAYREKKQSGISVDFDMKLEALLPVLDGSLPAHFHAHRADDIFTALRIIREFKLNGVLVHATEGWRIADVLANSGIPVITGPILTDRSKPELQHLSLSGPGRLSAAGIKPALCTDHPVIPCAHLMLCAALAHREGMDELEALRSVTLYAAVAAGVSQRTGSLVPGKDADLALWPFHPFDVTHGPSLVVSGGNIVFRTSTAS